MILIGLLLILLAAAVGRCSSSAPSRSRTPRTSTSWRHPGSATTGPLLIAGALTISIFWLGGRCCARASDARQASARARNRPGSPRRSGRRASASCRMTSPPGARNWRRSVVATRPRRPACVSSPTSAWPSSTWPPRPPASARRWPSANSATADLRPPLASADPACVRVIRCHGHGSRGRKGGRWPPGSDATAPARARACTRPTRASPATSTGRLTSTCTESSPRTRQRSTLASNRRAVSAAAEHGSTPRHCAAAPASTARSAAVSARRSVARCRRCHKHNAVTTTSPAVRPATMTVVACSAGCPRHEPRQWPDRGI